MECRTCLSSTEAASLNRISESTIEQIWECTGVRVFPDDGLPDSMCSQCGERLRIAHEFRQLCRRSDERLRSRRPVKVEIEIIKAELPDDENETKDYEEPKPMSDDGGEGRRFECAQCPKRFAQAVTLANHLATHSDERPHACAHCPKRFKAARSLWRHRKQFPCKEYMRKHLERCAAEPRHKREPRLEAARDKTKRFACSECSYAAADNYRLARHSRTHTGERPFACPLCPKRFTQISSLAYHQSTHSDARPYACSHCPKRFKESRTLLRHAIAHDVDVGEFECDACGKRFPRKEYVKKHLERCAGNPGRRAPAMRDSQTRKFACDLCGMSLSSKPSLRNHLNRHYDVRNFSCETCGADFVTVGELRSHARTHAPDDKRFACDKCDFRSHQVRSLEMHALRVHSTERPHACDSCEFRCLTLAELAAHRRKHTKERKFKCPVCDDTFTRTNCAKKHLLRAHGIAYDARGAIGKREANVVKIVDAS